MSMHRRGVIGRSLELAAGASALPLSRRAAAAFQATPVSGAAAGATWDPYARLPALPTFTLTSSDVADGVQFPLAQMSGVFGAGGEDRSPHLAWSGFPAETRGFFLTMFDPDAPLPSGFWHWAVADIPANVTELAAGAGAAGDAALPKGAYQIPNDARLAQYIGAAPPAGDPPHRYFIVVTAVDVETSGVAKDATPAFLYASLIGHMLARAIMAPISAPGEGG